MNIQKLIALLVGMGMLLLMCWYGSNYLTLEQFKMHKAYLTIFVEHHYFFAVLVFCAVCFVASVSMLPVSLLLALTGGFLFGAIPGALYTNLSVTAGATIMLLILRNFCSPWVERRYGHRLHTFNAELESSGANYLLMINLLTVVPFFIVSLLVSLTKVSWFTFMWTLFFGFLPSALIFAFAGRQLGSVQSISDILSGKMMIALVLLALLAMLPIIIKRYKLHKKAR